MKMRLFTILLSVICFESFAQKDPNYFNSDLIINRSNYFFKGNVKSVQFKSKDCESILLFDQKGYLQKRVNVNFKYKSSDSLLVKYYYSNNRLEYYQLYVDNHIFKTVYIDYLQRPILSKIPQNDTLVNVIKYCYELNNKIEEMRYNKTGESEKLSSRFLLDSSFNILEHYSWNKYGQLDYGIFRNQFNVDSIYNSNPKAKVKITNFKKIGNKCLEKYYSNMLDNHDYIKESIFENEILKSTKQIYSDGIRIEELYNNFGKLISRQNFNKNDSIYFIEKNEYDSIGRMTKSYTSSVGYFYINKKFNFKNDCYSIIETSDDYRKELLFDYQDNLLKASQNILRNCNEADCCDIEENKYQFNWLDCIKSYQEIYIEYDSFGNWVKLKEYVNGKLENENVRIIEYY